MEYIDIIGINPYDVLKKVFKDLSVDLNLNEVLIAKCLIDAMYEVALENKETSYSALRLNKALSKTFKQDCKTSLTMHDK